MYINGERVGAESGDTYQLVNPATGQPLSLVSKAKATDVSKAVGFAFETSVALALETKREADPWPST